MKTMVFLDSHCDVILAFNSHERRISNIMIEASFTRPAFVGTIFVAKLLDENVFCININEQNERNMAYFVNNVILYKIVRGDEIFVLDSYFIRDKFISKKKK